MTASLLLYMPAFSISNLTMLLCMRDKTFAHLSPLVQSGFLRHTQLAICQIMRETQRMIITVLHHCSFNKQQIRNYICYNCSTVVLLIITQAIIISYIWLPQNLWCPTGFKSHQEKNQTKEVVSKEKGMWRTENDEGWRKAREIEAQREECMREMKVE